MEGDLHPCRSFCLFFLPFYSFDGITSTFFFVIHSTFSRIGMVRQGDCPALDGTVLSLFTYNIHVGQPQTQKQTNRTAGFQLQISLEISFLIWFGLTFICFHLPRYASLFACHII